MVFFKAPFGCLISGSSGSGKTTIVERIIDNADKMIEPSPKAIIFYYAHWQPAYERLKSRGVHFVKGVPIVDDMRKFQGCLICIDDQMSANISADFFTKAVHHENVSIIYIVQNLFAKNSEHRTISLNCHYIILTKSPRDKSQINCLARQVYPNKPGILSEAFEDSTKEGFGYIALDFSQKTDDKYRLRTAIFPNEDNWVYIPV